MNDVNEEINFKALTINLQINKTGRNKCAVTVNNFIGSNLFDKVEHFGVYYLSTSYPQILFHDAMISQQRTVLELCHLAEGRGHLDSAQSCGRRQLLTTRFADESLDKKNKPLRERFPATPQCYFNRDTFYFHCNYKYIYSNF